jgi:protein-S-isoprenylcysteine O-methyltransferase Ste14
MPEAKQFPWAQVLGNFLWVLGGAIILATLSWHEFRVSTGEVKWPEVIKSQAFQRPVYLGLTFIMAGIASSINSPWISAFGGAGAFFFLFLLIRTFIKK